MRRSRLSQFKLPAATVLIGLGITIIITALLERAARERERFRFERLADNRAQAIKDGVDYYAMMVRALAGLFSSGLEIDAGQFNRFVDRVTTRERSPAVESLAWSPLVPSEKTEEFLKWARAKIDPNFRIWPEPVQPSFPISFIWPDLPSFRRIRGFNPASEASRRSAMEAAILTGIGRITPPIRLVHEPDPQSREPEDESLPFNGFAYFTPVYEGVDIPNTPELRREKIMGLCGGGFRTADYLQKLFPEMKNPTEIELYDGARPGQLILMARYAANAPGFHPRNEQWREMEVWGRVWTVKVSSRPEFELAGDSEWARSVAIIGTLVSLLLGWMTWRRASIAGELAMSKAELIHLNHELEDLVSSRTKVAEERAARLRTVSEELINAEQRERGRIAQILHDDLQQILVAAKMKLAAAVGKFGEEDLKPVNDLITKGIQTGRNLSSELEPGVIKDRGLAAALEWAVRKTLENYGLEVKTDIDPAAEPASENVSVFLLRASQEALLNVVKHSGVTQAELSLKKLDENWLEITISDKGKGCDEEVLSPIPAERFGLFILKNRLELLGGEFEIRSAPGEGCVVRMVAPLG